MKILFITNMYPTKTHPYYGIHIKEQIDSLEKQYGVKSSVFFINSLDKGKLAYLITIPRIIQKIRANNFDNIHIHYGLSALFLFFYKPNIKVFLTLHGGDILNAQGKNIQVILTKWLIKRVSKVFILNNEMEQIISKTTTPYEMIPCGVDTEFFKSPFIQNEGNEKTILFPGDPDRLVKNYPLFLEVSKILKRNSLYKIKVKIIHGLKREEVVNILSSSDCLVMTSISEGSPQIIKEALSTNLPIVSVPVGDVAIITKGIPGCYVTKTFNPKEISDYILRAFEERSEKIRSCFIDKNKFDQISVAKNVFKNYSNK